MALYFKPVMTETDEYEDVTRPRQIGDLINEMNLELLNLPRFTAYVKVVQEVQGQQLVGKHKITTYQLPEPNAPTVIQTQIDEIRQRTREHYGKKRAEIEEEIKERQAPWRTYSLDQDLSRQSKQRLPKDRQPREKDTEEQSPEPPPQWSS